MMLHAASINLFLDALSGLAVHQCIANWLPVLWVFYVQHDPLIPIDVAYSISVNCPCWWSL